MRRFLLLEVKPLILATVIGVVAGVPVRAESGVPTNYLDYLFCLESFNEIRACYAADLSQQPGARVECAKEKGVSGKCLEFVSNDDPPEELTTPGGEKWADLDGQSGSKAAPVTMMRKKIDE
ncbi:hypothetical protein [Lysobacter gummosus]|uniref:Uncharacterized protein n=1 Tax=Lysobacter gummosus TaxID=262324 RepID=A0ABY3XC50_9GAMM|nr:hypothetical protein [Lysobacter gummosus]UNP29190.1 hypothetical protein MOV92_22420 [Lysobacter gummosus]